MRQAATVMSGARSDAQKVVLFFTDGEPGDYGFDSSVANGAITSSKDLKGSGTLVYTIGVVDGADPSNTTTQINGYMHAVSSNYPNATAWNNLGDRAEVSEGVPTQYYKATTSADELNKIFSEIAGETQNAATGSPTEVGSGDPAKSGYLTFTDTLGDYMKVDTFSSIVYADKQYSLSSKSTDGNVDTYKFSGVAGDSNGYYPAGKLDDIIITVERSGDGKTDFDGDEEVDADDASLALKQGDTVTVQIPATLIPLRNFKIDTDADGNTAFDVTEAYPIRIAYGVSLKSDVDNLLKNPDDVMKDYVEANKDGNDVSFYSNSYTKGAADGLTKVTFDPSLTNNFYTFPTDTTLYSDAACTTKATGPLDKSKSYWYQRDYYVLNKDTKTVSVETSKIELLLNSSSVLTVGNYVGEADDGTLYIKAESPRLQRVGVDTVTVKTENDHKTGTATNVINPVWATTAGTSDYTKIEVHLGNNGKLTKEMPGALTVTKNVEVPEGFTNNFADTEFDFTIALKNADGSIASGTFDAVVTNKLGEVQGDPFTFTLENGEYTHTLLDGQTLTVRGLTAGTTYTVTEVNAPTYFEQAKTGDTGTIAANATSAAVFTNTYNPADAVMPADSIRAQKDLEGRSWHEGDAFAFYMLAEGEAPLPAGEQADSASGSRYVLITATNEDIIPFGQITFDTPGTYNYEIREVIPEEGDRLPGISYPQSAYTATVQVSDDGNGTLSIVSVKMTKDVSENGAPINPGTEVSERVAVFTNTYNAETIEANITGTKRYADNSGKNGMTANKFTFTAAPITEGAPVPETGVAADGSFSFGHTATGEISFPTVKFTSDMDGQSFEYTVKENIPTEANASNNYTYQGMTYDPTVWTVTATVVVDPAVNPDPDDPTKGAISVLWSAKSSAETGTGTSTHVTFTNSYTPTPAVLTGDANIRGSKTLDGRDAKEKEDFTFTITGENEATRTAMTDGSITFKNGTTATVSGAKNGVEQSFDFGDATFTKPGTYTFNINENVPATNPGGMTYDAHTSTVTVEVVDNNGVLTATVGAYNNGTDKPTDRAAFVNTYRASLNYSESVDLYVSKTLNGRDMAAGEFSFTITGSNGFSETASNKAAGNGVADGIKMLNGITFTQADVGKTYTYTVDEVDPSDEPGPSTTLPGVTYDEDQYEIVVVVSDNGNGTLSTITSVFRLFENANGETVSEELGTFDTNDKIPNGTVAFVNTYKANPVEDNVTARVPLTKEVVGRDWLTSETFSFTVTKNTFNGSNNATELAKMPDPTSPITVSKPADGNSTTFGLGTMTFDQAGTYEYRVIEDKGGDVVDGLLYSSNVAYVTITVEDDTEKGELVVTNAAVTVGSSTFTNSFSSEFNFSDAVTFQLSKTLTGHAMTSGQFHFTVTAADTASAEKIQLPAGTLSADVPGSASADGVKVIMPNGGDIVFNHSVEKDADGNYVINTDSEKTFSYTFSEVIPEGAVEENGVYTKDGYTYDSSVYTLTIVPVMHTSTGKWEITTTLSKTLNGKTDTVASSVWNQNVDTNVKIEAPADFENFYNATGTMPVNGTKAITSGVNTWPGDLSGFDFTLTAADEATSNAIASGAVVLPGTPESADKPVTTSSATSAADGAFSFGDVTFAKAGNYTFEVSEVEPGTGKPGITYTKEKVTIAVAVTDNNDGTLKVEVANNANTGMTFTNIYSTTESTAYVVDIKKEVTGHDAVEQFGFTMVAADDETKAAIDANLIKGIAGKDGGYKSTVATTGDLIANGESQTLNFPYLVFGKTGTYTFNVTEDNAAPNTSWTYDSHAYTVKVVVSDVNANMIVAESTDGINQENQNSTFTNSFATKTTYGDEGGLNVTKTLNGRNLLEGEFSFTITGADDASTAKLTDESDKSFSNSTPDDQGIATMQKLSALSFDQTDIGKTYTYVVSETIPEGAVEKDGVFTKDGITFDNKPVTVAIKVLEKNGDIYTETTVTKNGVKLGEYSSADEKTAAVAPFANAYSSTGGQADTDTLFTKSISGRDWKEGDEFTFTLTPNEGAPLRDEQGTVQQNRTATASYENVKDGKVTFGFGKLHYTFDDIKDVAPVNGQRTKTFTYNVTENDTNIAGITKDPDTATITVTLTDDGAGNLTAAAVVTAANADFVNTYSTEVDYNEKAGMQITKKLTGRDMTEGQFEWTVAPTGNNASETAAKFGIDESGVVVKSSAATNDTLAIMPVTLGGNVTFTNEDANKVYAFQVSETKKGGTGYTNDESVYTVKVAPTFDAATGVLTVTTTVENAAGEVIETKVATSDKTQTGGKVTVPFENRYNAGSVTLGGEGNVKINATKTLTNRPMVDDEFSFVVTNTANTDPDAKPVTTGKSKADGRIVFENIEYTTASLEQDLKNGLVTRTIAADTGAYTYTYQYLVSESKVTTAGVAAVTQPQTIIVKVTDAHDGTPLSVGVTYPDGMKDGLKFENTYGVDAQDEVDIAGIKVLGYSPQELAADAKLTQAGIAGKYTFKISGVDENGNAAPMPTKDGVVVPEATNDAAGNVVFGKISFTMESVFGDTGDAQTRGTVRTKVFTYTVTETGELAGVKNDDAAETGKTFTVTVTDNGDGTLSAKTSAEAPAPLFQFTNTYSITTPEPSTVTDQVSITKKLDGREMVGGEFNFELVEMVDGKETVVAKGSNAVDGKVTFEAITYSAPGEHDYLVREVNNGKGGVTYDTKNYSIHTSVTDNGNGTLSVKHELKDAQEALFTNTYEADPATVNLGVAKLLNNAKPGDARFTFQVLDKDGKVVAEAQNDEDGAVKFPTLTFDAAGEYDYTIVEVNDGQEGVTYDENKIAVKVVVSATDAGGNYTGQLYPSVEYADGTSLFSNTYAEPEGPANPGGSEPPALPDTSDTFGPLVMGLGALAVIACAGLVIGAVKMRRKPGVHRSK